MELADAVLVNKADAENLERSESARAELDRVLSYLQPATRRWSVPARCCCAREDVRRNPDDLRRRVAEGPRSPSAALEELNPLLP